ncbi:MAG: hypothetical protein ACRCWU_01975 [Metamycoplasmataceae bacterium]
MNLNIKTKHNNYYLTYHGLKIFQTDYCTKLIKEILDQSNITINNLNVKYEDIIVIDELTKINSFLTINKNSKINEKIFSILNKNKIINESVIENIKLEINKTFEVITNNDGDINKLINILFSILELGYLEEKSLIYLLDEILIEKKYLIIFNDISWLKLSILEKYLNNYNFIVITNDFRKIIRNKKDLSLIVVSNNNNYLEIEDEDKIIAYTEKNTNISLRDDKEFTRMISDPSSNNSILIFNLIKNII